MRCLLIGSVFLLALGGCASSNAPGQAQSGAFVAPPRPSDNLLARPDLQALVDLQVRRNSAGLVEALASPDSVVRARAALALGSVQDPAAVSALRRALDDPAGSVRADAAFAVGQSADSSAGVALIVSIRTEDNPTVQAELLDALGKTGGRADLAALLGIPLAPRMEAVRAMAIARFGIRGISSPDAAAWAAERLQTADGALREASAYLFTRAPVAAWRAELPTIRLAFDGLVGDAARMHLARALGRAADDQDLPRLLGALASDPDWRIRVNVATAVGAFQSNVSARNGLADAIYDAVPHVGVTAAGALARAPGFSSDEVARIADMVADESMPWQTQAPLVPILARAGNVSLITDWSAKQTSVFAKAAATAALALSTDDASIERLFAEANSETPLLATAAVQSLRSRFDALDHPSRQQRAGRYFAAFADALRKRDLATTAAAAPILADSVFRPFGAGRLLREVYGQLSAPADLEPMAEIVKAIGKTRDGEEIEFLLGITLSGHPILRRAARDALNERLVEGIDVSLSGDDPGTGTIAIDWTHLARVGRHPRLVLETQRGEVQIRLDTESAPQTVQMLTRTAAGERYNGVPFHRVVPNFVVQGGDYFRMDGYGGPDTPIRSELNRNRYRTGTAGMASSGKDTEGVQFFLTHSPTPHLDGTYTVFGEVISGRAVVDSILQGDRIIRARLVPDPEIRQR